MHKRAVHNHRELYPGNTLMDVLFTMIMTPTITYGSKLYRRKYIYIVAVIDAIGYYYVRRKKITKHHYTECLVTTINNSLHVAGFIMCNRISYIP